MENQLNHETNILTFCQMVSETQTEVQRDFSAKVTIQVEATNFVVSDSTLRKIILDVDIQNVAKLINEYEQANVNQQDTPKS